jgi:hypothetical protein
VSFGDDEIKEAEGSELTMIVGTRLDVGQQTMGTARRETDEVTPVSRIWCATVLRPAV